MVAVLVPARNEEGSLPPLLEELRRAGTADRVLVVDNGSTDATARVAAGRGVEVVPEPRAGYGRACQRGIAHLTSTPPRPGIVVFVDADDRRAPAELSRLVAPLRRGRADLVLGSRRPPERVPRHAAAGNRLVSTILRGVYGWRGRDMGPLRAVSVTALDRLALDDPDFGWNVQMHVRALKRRLRVMEIPVRFEARRHGRSKISGRAAASLRAGRAMLATLAREIAAPRPRDS